MKKLFHNAYFWVSGFAVLNVAMYLAIGKFWIGGSSFLPMIGQFGDDNKFLFAFIVNMGVLLGAALGALVSKEFSFRFPNKEQVIKGIIGGTLIGMGITLAPGTCTTAFVTGMPMLSVASFLSAAGIFMGAYVMYKIIYRNNK